MRNRIYLAGPEVFLADAETIGNKKKAICADYGFEGISPLENDPSAVSAGREAVHRVSSANEALIRHCDVMVANVTPFRGPGLDGGTAFEIGFMRGLGRPIFGYTNVKGVLTSRTEMWLGDKIHKRSGDWGIEDHDGLLVENLGGIDNAMIDGGIHASGGSLVVSPTTERNRYRCLGGFRRCVALAQKLDL